MKKTNIKTSLEPWLSVPNALKAVAFYRTAFCAVITYRDEFPDGMVAKLSVDGSEFWVSGGLKDDGEIQNGQSGEIPVRFILTVDDPDYFFDRALKAGATQVFPIGEEHGWKLGRIIDPFGIHWEIGHPMY